MGASFFFAGVLDAGPVISSRYTTFSSRTTGPEGAFCLPLDEGGLTRTHEWACPNTKRAVRTENPEHE